MAKYDPRSLHAEEFINDRGICDAIGLLCKRKILFLFGILCVPLLASCSQAKQNSQQLGPSSTVHSSAASPLASTPVPAVTPDPTPAPLFSGGYEDSLAYKAILEIENCTDSDRLQAMLSDVYGEEVSCIKLEIQEGSDSVFNGYKEPYEHMMCSVTSFFQNEKAKAPVNTDTCLFFLPNHEEPIFLMDGDGAFLVSSYEYTNFDGGSYSLTVSSWVASELYLLAGGYLNDESKHNFGSGSGEHEAMTEREFMAEAAAKVDGCAHYFAKIACYVEPILGENLS